MPIPFASEDPTRFQLISLMCEQGLAGDENSVRQLEEFARTLRPDLTHTQVSEFVAETRQIDRVERDVVDIFAGQFLFHAFQAAAAHSEIRKIVEVIQGDRQKTRDATDPLWGHIVNFLAHAGSAHNIIKPPMEHVKLNFRSDQLTPADKARRREHREYRGRLVRRALGVKDDDPRYHDWLTALQDVRNAQTHFEESLDEAVLDFIQDQRSGFADRVLTGLSPAWPPAGVTVVRSYDVVEDRLSYLGRKTAKLSGLVTFLCAHHDTWVWNVQVGPAPYGHPLRQVEFTPEFTVT